MTRGAEGDEEVPYEVVVGEPPGAEEGEARHVGAAARGYPEQSPGRDAEPDFMDGDGPCPMQDAVVLRLEWEGVLMKRLLNWWCRRYHTHAHRGEWVPQGRHLILTHTVCEFCKRRYEGSTRRKP